MTTDSHHHDRKSLSYRDAGVDIDAGNRLVKRIGRLARSTARPGAMGELGGFGGLFDLAGCGYRDPVLVSGTDGVGTKLALAMQLGTHDSIGIDLVAMCVNDIVVTGAEPLFFLDYYATSKLDVDMAEQVIAGIAEGCRRSGAVLLGGETAEMPGMYQGNEYDLAGFCVGVVERDRMIDGHRVETGDKLVGLMSSGPHSNGYSLIRKILNISGSDPQQAFDGGTLGQALLTPTRIYVKSLLQLTAAVDVHALCHITGGGLLENLPRVLPANRVARIDVHAWPRPPVFDWLQQHGAVVDTEMYRTFNCGVGMVACVAAQDLQQTLDILTSAGETTAVIGTIGDQAGPAAVELCG